MIRTAIIAAILILLSVADQTMAAKGEVVFRKAHCDYFLVETDTGFVLLEWYGGNDPDEGDVLVGDFESHGTKDIFNLSADSELRVRVEDYWLSKDEALEQLYEECD